MKLSSIKSYSNFLYFLLVLVSFSLLLPSCSLEKRRHLSGYHITFKNRIHPAQASKKSIDQNEIRARISIKNETFSDGLTPILQENRNQHPTNTLFAHADLSESSATHEIGADSIKCDRLTLRNGDELPVKVTEIGATEIRYKNCDDPDGPTRVVAKSDVFMIVYSSGKKDFFGTEAQTTNSEEKLQQETESKTQTGNQVTSPMAILGLVFGILGLLLSWIYPLGWFFGGLGIVFGGIALMQIKNNPDRFKGKGLAAVALITGGLGFIFATGWFILVLLLL